VVERQEGRGVDARTIAMAGVMLAFVFIMTWLPKVPIGPGGYIHLGDAAIYVAAFLFGPVVGTFAAAFGTTFADLAAGYGVFAPGTFVIHGLQGLVAALIAWRRGMPRMVVAVIAGGAIVVIGYFLFQAYVLREGIGASAVYLWPNTFQVIAGGAIGIAATVLVRRAYPPVTSFGQPVVWQEHGRA
jgi:energy-coupling factor transport system substrate-specific component